MPKTFSLNELVRVLLAPHGAPVPSAASEAGGAAASPDIVSSQYYLIMLGTDGKFEPVPQPLKVGELKPPSDRPFVRGELHSYLARFLAEVVHKETPETQDPTQTLSYSSHSVDVLKGPDKYGSDVGDRIARGVFLALKAAANGKTTLNITGHSRGAVECMFVMHELDRIKKALANRNGKTLREIVCGSLSTASNSTTQTKEALEKLFPIEKTHEKDKEVDETDEVLDLLRDRLNEFEVNAYLIDPVPGSPPNILGTGFKAWRDPLFSSAPPCKHYELLVCNDERSWYFNPFIPLGWSFTLVDGHHGSPIGNIFTQTLEKLSPPFKDDRVEAVQDLTLLKFIRFLTLSTGQFKDRSSASIDLGHGELDRLVSNYLGASQRDRDKQILDLYVETETLRNKKTFEQYRAYSYIGLYAYDAQRLVHYETDKLVALNELRHTHEHANWTIDYLTDSSLGAGNSQLEPPRVLDRLHRTLDGLIGAMQITTDTSRIDKHFDRILLNETERSSLFKALSVLVNSLSQEYLSGKLPTDEKPGMLGEVRRLFLKLAEATEHSSVSDKHKTILKQCQDILLDGIKQTVENHHKVIALEANRLYEEIQIHLATPEQLVREYTNAIQSFCSAFKKNEPEGLVEWSSQVSARLIAVTPKTNQFIEERLRAEVADLKSNSMDPALKEKAQEKIFGDLYKTHLRPYKNVELYNHDYYLSKLGQLFSDTRELAVLYSELRTFMGEKSLEVGASDFDRVSVFLLNLAGRVLKKKGGDLSGIPQVPTIAAEIIQHFNEQAKCQAIALGAPSPEVLAERAHFETRLADAVASEARIQAELDTSRALEAQLRNATATLTSELAEAHSSITRLTQVLEERTSSINQLIQCIKELESAQTTHFQEASLLKRDLATSQTELAAAIAAKKNLEEQVASTTLAMEKLQALLETKDAESQLHRDFEATQAELIQVTADKTSLEEQLTTATAARAELQTELEAARTAAISSTGELQRRLEEANRSIALLQEQSSSAHSEHIQPLESHPEQPAPAPGATREDSEQLIHQLNSKKELDSGLLIQEKLCSLTEKYLHHLLTQAHKYVPTIDAKTHKQELPALDEVTNMSPSKKGQYQQILNKYIAVKELYEKLTDVKQNPLPSKRIEMFNESLSKKATQIKFRRDPKWPLYLKGCLAALVVATGIIPGLIVYSIFTGNSPLFFGTSGEKYIQDVERKIHKPPTLT